MHKKKFKINKIIYMTILSFYIFIFNNKIVGATNITCSDYVDGLEPLNACPGKECTMAFIKRILGYVKIIIPILLILLGTIDFVKAIIAKDDEQMKKAQGDFVKRLIIGVVILFVPMILGFILDVAGFGDSCFNELIKF